MLEYRTDLTVCTCKISTTLTLISINFDAKIYTYNYVNYLHKRSVQLTEELHQK